VCGLTEPESRLACENISLSPKGLSFIILIGASLGLKTYDLFGQEILH